MATQRQGISHVCATRRFVPGPAAHRLGVQLGQVAQLNVAVSSSLRARSPLRSGGPPEPPERVDHSRAAATAADSGGELGAAAQSTAASSRDWAALCYDGFQLTHVGQLKDDVAPSRPATTRQCASRLCCGPRGRSGAAGTFGDDEEGRSTDPRGSVERRRLAVDARRQHDHAVGALRWATWPT